MLDIIIKDDAKTMIWPADWHTHNNCLFDYVLFTTRFRLSIELRYPIPWWFIDP